MEAQANNTFRDILNDSDLNVPDGMPLVWVGHVAGFPEMDRVYGPDFILEVSKASVEKGLSHFFYGGKPGVADELALNLSQMFPGLKVAGTYCPPFAPLSQQERDEIIAMIERSAASFVWVGLSTPKQEHWMSQFAPSFHGNVLFGVGAAFDYNTGRLDRAPRWMQMAGLEWFFRLIQEPKRLFRRYVVNNPKFLLSVLMQLTGVRKFRIIRG